MGVRKFPLELLANDGPMSDEMGNNEFEEVAKRFEAMNGLDAVRVLMMLFMRKDSSVLYQDVECFAQYLGVFFEEGNEEDFE